MSQLLSFTYNTSNYEYNLYMYEYVYQREQPGLHENKSIPHIPMKANSISLKQQRFPTLNVENQFFEDIPTKVQRVIHVARKIKVMTA